MNYRETFEDETFIYQLDIQSSDTRKEHLHTFSQGNGYYGSWVIEGKGNREQSLLTVTDDQCEVIVFSSVEAAVRGSKDFLAL